MSQNFLFRRSFRFIICFVNGSQTSSMKRCDIFWWIFDDTKKLMTSPTSEKPKRVGWQIVLHSSTCFLNVLESVNLSIPWNPQFLITKSIHQSGDSLSLNTSPISSESYTVLTCHINITCSTDPETVELPIISSYIGIYNYVDVEIDGFLKESFEHSVSVLSRSSRVVS